MSIDAKDPVLEQALFHRARLQRKLHDLQKKIADLDDFVKIHNEYSEADRMAQLAAEEEGK